MKLVIDRKTWIRGDWDLLPYGSSLLDKRGHRCCLGFLGQACGIENPNLLNVSSPGQVGCTEKNLWPKGVLDSLGHNSKWVTMAIHLNDSQDSSGMLSLKEYGKGYYPEVGLGDKYRERLLTRHFAEIGIEASFEG